MPRKGNYLLDYDADDYGDNNEEDCYDNYEDDEDELQDFTNEKDKSGMWHCSICTYANENDMFACDICGVIRQPLDQSKLEKNNVPFKFDIPSPDDLVSRGLQHAKKDMKGSMDNISRSNLHKTEPESSSFPLPHVGKVLQEQAGGSDINSEQHYASPYSSFIGDDKLGKGASLDGNKPQLVVNSMNTMSLSTNTDSRSRGGKLGINYKPEKWMLPSKEDEALSQLNLAIVGHVDSGKSTLSGRLLHLQGRITQKEMHKYEKEAKLQGKGSFAYAWALDESQEERERGITMTVAVAYFDTQKHHVVVLDSPGHKDFVPNMISGATQADAAILVIDAAIGAFEAGMELGKGQTREHAQLIKSFGVDHLIVAVNKMDAVGFSKDRFNSIKLHLGAFLRTCNFKDSFLTWVPVSSLANQNLACSPTDERLSSWYRGPHLLHAIDSIPSPLRDFAKPLLMPVCDVVKSSAAQVSVGGKLEAGALQKGSKVLFMPTGDLGTVKSVERGSKLCNIARAGDSVVINVGDIDGNNVFAGGVLCHPDFRCSVGHRLQLKVIVFDVKTPLLVGSQLEFHIHHAKEAATVARLISLLDSKTGNPSKKTPRCLTSKQSGIIEVVLQRPVCVELFSHCRALGRVFLRSSGRTIAVGVVTKVGDDEV